MVAWLLTSLKKEASGGSKAGAR